MMMMKLSLHLLVVIFGTLSTSGLAVDKKKFRTCSKTSFCRRHRGKHSAPLYNYRLDKESVHFHVPIEASAHSDAVVSEKNDGSLWKSLQDRILRPTDSTTAEDSKDPYVRGPPPTLTGILINNSPETSSESKERLEWSVHAMGDGVVRMRVTEVYQTPGPFQKARVTYDDVVLTSQTMHAAKHAQWIRPGEEYLSNVVDADQLHNHMGLQYGDQEGEPGMFLLVRLDSFAVFLYRENDFQAGPIMTLGNQGMMHFEVRRLKNVEPTGEQDTKDDENDNPNQGEQEEVKPEKEIVGYWEDGLAIYADGTREERKTVEDEHRQLTELELDREGLWEESFQSHQDSKPFGPMSVGMDIHFPNSHHLFGIPEHASSTVLKTTYGEGAYYSDPYRLYNLDVFEYELDEPMALYGSVPLIVSQSKATGTAAMFWFNPTETFVDIMEDGHNSMSSHWMSESGIVDLFLIPGPTPSDVYRQYAQLTGTAPIPPMFSLGYHQCRWNYKDEKDVYYVHDKFEELDYPYDVLWLDIEHTNGKRYFTWDENLFPNPKEMQEKLWSQGRRMVTIVDPHIMRDNNYYIHKEATAKGLYIKDKDGNKDFDGWCWPGSSSYLDFTNERVRSWWADQFSFDRYQGSTPSLFTWNDMNEPSVFNGPEVTMQKDLRNLDGHEHREWHNLYGMLFHRSTSEGQLRRNKPDENVRPFVLSRAFFAGSQSYGAIWTGDNAAEWSHLAIAAPMLLSLNVAALSFVGADVGGFFLNTDAELMTRWMQAGAYTPFFRGHAHHDTKRKEPWVYGEETMVRLRKAAMARYALLPYWYAVFREAYTSGMPVMRTMWMQYPGSEALFSVDDQYLVGSDILVKPVTAPNVVESKVKFPTDNVWYDVETLIAVSSEGEVGGVNELTVASGIDKIPVYQRGGSIIPRKLRLRRSSRLMMQDPYTLYIALSGSKTAEGKLYVDDEETLNHDTLAEYAESIFTAEFGAATGVIKNSVTFGAGWKNKADAVAAGQMVERIIVMGVQAPPSAAKVAGVDVDFTFDQRTKVLVLRKPGVSALQDWEMNITV